jgi:hypothetical protein
MRLEGAEGPSLTGREAMRRRRGLSGLAGVADAAPEMDFEQGSEVFTADEISGIWGHRIHCGMEGRQNDR